MIVGFVRLIPTFYEKRLLLNLKLEKWLLLDFNFKLWLFLTIFCIKVNIFELKFQKVAIIDILLPELGYF